MATLLLVWFVLSVVASTCLVLIGLVRHRRKPDFKKALNKPSIEKIQMKDVAYALKGRSTERGVHTNRLESAEKNIARSEVDDVFNDLEEGWAESKVNS